MGNLVDTHHDHGVMVITVNNAPVNALSQGVPDGIKDAIALAATDDSVKAVVIVGGGKTFIAGADINELEAAARHPDLAPDIHLLLEVVENSAQPVVMAIHGTALGGGIELALAAHYRVAVPEAMLGMPEANLGIVPGGEGTQRLPRVVGIPAAIDLLITGRIMKAPEAKQLGLVDRVIEVDLLTGAVAFAREIAGRPLIRTRDREIAGFDAGAFEAGRALAKKIRPNQTAPAMALEALEVLRQEFKHLDQPGVRKPAVHDRMYATGRYGQKTGAGWYKYDEKMKRSPDPFSKALVERMSAEWALSGSRSAMAKSSSAAST